MAPDGSVLRAPDDTAAVIDRIAAGGYQSVAIVLLHAYANPAHEQQMAAALAACLPGIRLSLSSVVAPKYREYELTSTTVANAYVAPLVKDYISALSTSLAGPWCPRRDVDHAVERRRRLGRTGLRLPHPDR